MEKSQNIKLYFADDTTAEFGASDKYNVREAFNNRADDERGLTISITLTYKELTEEYSTAIKDMLSENTEKTLTKVEWILDDNVMETLTGDAIIYEWDLGTPDNIQETIIFFVNKE